MIANLTLLQPFNGNLRIIYRFRDICLFILTYFNTNTKSGNMLNSRIHILSSNSRSPALQILHSLLICWVGWVGATCCGVFCVFFHSGCKASSISFVVCLQHQLCNNPMQYAPKICIKYRKHWKSYVSFQLSGQIGQVGLNWAVRNYSPNWHQFSHERPMTILKSIFKKWLKSEKVGLPCFQTKKECLF